jgi:hypothetical protein
VVLVTQQGGVAHRGACLGFGASSVTTLSVRPFFQPMIHRKDRLVGRIPRERFERYECIQLAGSTTGTTASFPLREWYHLSRANHHLSAFHKRHNTFRQSEDSKPLSIDPDALLSGREPNSYACPHWQLTEKNSITFGVSGMAVLVKSYPSVDRVKQYCEHISVSKLHKS